MALERRHGNVYYYRKHKRGRRVVSEYVGRGELALMVAASDAARIAAQRQARQARQTVYDLARPPVQLTDYATAVRGVVVETLEALGFHQHKRQWRMRMDTSFDRALQIYRKAKPSKDELVELRLLVNAHTSVARLGDVALLAERTFLAGYNEQPAVRAAIDERCGQLRRQLGWAESTELERILINEVVLTWLDYYRLTMCHAQQTREFTMSTMEAWERVLSGKQRRYLRAIETLARVRRLLRLPTVQITVDARTVNVENRNDQR
jgi:hypothetical protein